MMQSGESMCTALAVAIALLILVPYMRDAMRFQGAGGGRGYGHGGCNRGQGGAPPPPQAACAGAVDAAACSGRAATVAAAAGSKEDARGEGGEETTAGVVAARRAAASGAEGKEGVTAASQRVDNARAEQEDAWATATVGGGATMKGYRNAHSDSTLERGMKQEAPLNTRSLGGASGAYHTALNWNTGLQPARVANVEELEKFTFMQLPAISEGYGK